VCFQSIFIIILISEQCVGGRVEYAQVIRHSKYHWRNFFSIFQMLGTTLSHSLEFCAISECGVFIYLLGILFWTNIGKPLFM
jgi:hypothetical protein